MRRPGVSADGFTLVEVLLALFLIAVALLAAAPMFIYAARVNDNGAETGSAAALATDRIELLRAEPFGTLVDGGDLASNVSGYFDDTDPNFTVRWKIEDAAGPGRCRRISVRAQSRGPSVGPPRQVTLETLRAP